MAGLVEKLFNLSYTIESFSTLVTIVSSKYVTNKANLEKDGYTLESTWPRLLLLLSFTRDFLLNFPIW